MLLLLGLTAETNRKIEVSDKFFSARKTSTGFSLPFSIPASIILLGSLGLFFTVFVHIRRAKQKGMFFKKISGGLN